MRKYFLVTFYLFAFCVLLLSKNTAATVILQYHHISNDTPAATSLSPTLFRKHIEHLSAAQYTVLSLPEVVAALKNGQSLPDRSVVITFDDGYDSVYREAYPVLKAKGWPFTVFVNTRPLENKMAGFTTWQQLQEMAANGATIANHSHTHTHFLRRENNESERQWRQRIRDDIETAERIIKQRTGQNHKLLAYPYGEYNDAVKSIVKELGFIAFGQQSGPIGNPAETLVDFLVLPRFPFGGSYGDEEDFKTKVATVAMPIKSIKIYAKAGGDLVADTVLPANVEQPLMRLELNGKLASAIQCFASGQGAIEIEVQDQSFTTRAKRALPVGRSRYNCTSATGESGRFYWYSHMFIRKQADGSWYYEP